MTLIKAPCSRAYFPAHLSSGQRPRSAVKLIVLHSTEGGTAESNARYFHAPGAGGSAHLVIDDDVCYRCLANITIPQAAPGANTIGFHIEQAGYAAWTRREWLAHDAMLDRVAYKIAQHAVLFKLPIMFRTAADLAAGKRGVTTHHAVTRWQNSIGEPGSHTDPGKGYPLDVVLDQARKYRKALPK